MTDIICFHNPDEENGYLSNWYPSHFVVDRVLLDGTVHDVPQGMLF